MAKKPELLSSVDALLDQELDAAEKKFGISTTLVDPDEAKMSSGLLALDLITFGGIRSGGWYTIFGPEQSCKSTLAVSISGALMDQRFHDHGRGIFWDAEGSSDPEYISNIFDTNNYNFDYGDLFGIKAEDGEWLKRGAFRFYQEDDGGTFFDIMNKVKRTLPRVTRIDDVYYYEYEKNKVNDARYKNVAVEKLSKDKFWLVPCPEGYSGQPQMVTLLDSYPSLLPEAMDKDEASGAIGQQARMFSDGIKRVKGGMRRRKMVIIGVNQLREKPMVMFGCLHADTKIPLVDGRSFTIQQIVEERIKGEVWSFNEKTKQLEAKPIIQWNYNGEVETANDWISITSKCPETANGQACVRVTPDHEVLTDHGWIRAKDLDAETHRVVSRYESVYNSDVKSFLNGVLAGDSCLVRDCSYAGRLRLTDSLATDYVDWKVEKLGQAIAWSELPSTSGYHSESMAMFSVIGDRTPNRNFTNLEDFDDLSLAVYYMDDGHLRESRGYACLSIKRFKQDVEMLESIVEFFAELDLPIRYNIEDGNFTMDKDTSDKFFQRIAKYVPKCMNYKLPEQYRNMYEDFELDFQLIDKPVYVDIIKIVRGSPTSFRKRGKYDLSIADNKNYLAGNRANGFIVHNSPEYEPAGNALKFYSDVRIKAVPRALPAGWEGKGMVMEEKSVLEDGGQDKYRFINIKAIKNKLGGLPYQEGWLRLWITDATGQARGFDPVYDTFFYLKTLGYMTGTRNNMKFRGCRLSSVKKGAKIDWLTFKMLVIGTKKEKTELCEKLGIKPFDLRKWCFADLDSGRGLDRYRRALVGKSNDEVEDGDGEDLAARKKKRSTKRKEASTKQKKAKAKSESKKTTRKTKTKK